MSSSHFAPDGSAHIDGSEPLGGLDSVSHRVTPIPPEWALRDSPRSASSLTLERNCAEPPIGRRVGPRAEQPYFISRLRLAVEAGDSQAEAEFAIALARRLAAAGAELDLATKLARRSLQLRDDLGVREELAGWLAGLGEPAMSAALLRPMAEGQLGERAARLLTRAAVLFARAGDARSAIEALAEAGRRDPLDPTAPELYAAVGAWAPEMLASEQVAQGYLEGCLRRDALGEGAAAFEDLLRAFEVAPQVSAVAERLAAALKHRGRAAAADEVRREHARSRGGDGTAIHRLRALEAFAEGDYPRALGAAIDAGWDAYLDVAGARRALELEPRQSEQLSLDEVLERVGLHEIIAARLEIQADELRGPARAAALIPLALILEGPLALPDRAANLWVEALAAEPGAAPALQHIRDQAGSLRDQNPLIEALLRLGSVPADAFDERRVNCIRELAALAEQRLPDPFLAVWALRRLREVGVEEPELAAAESRNRARISQQEELLGELHRSLGRLSGSARLTALRRLASLLRARPDRMESYLSVLQELVDGASNEPVWLGMLERALDRTGHWAELDSLYQRRLEVVSVPSEREHLMLRRSALARRQGRGAAALEILSPLLDQAENCVSAWSIALCLAAKQGKPLLRARGWRKFSSRVAAPVRAAIQAAASQILLEIGETEEAEAAAEQAVAADPSQARALAARAEVALRLTDKGSTAALERAIGVLVPRAQMCQRLAAAYDELGDPLLALAWTQRWIALRPGDPAAIAALLSKVAARSDARRLADTLSWLLAQPQPLVRMIGPATDGLRTLLQQDRERASALSRRVLDVIGPRDANVRSAMMEVADGASEPGFAIAVIERYLVTGAPGAERPRVLLDLAERRRRAGDADGAARTLCRALTEGGDPTAVLEHLDQALPPRGSDGEVWLLQARAEALSAIPSVDLPTKSRAWREYGAALWDLAGDPTAAIQAWEHAASLDGENGVERAAADLVAFAGAEAATAHLEAFAKRRKEPSESARFLSVAGMVALAANLPAQALALAESAVNLDATSVEALAVAERAAGASELDVLERIYGIISEATLGQFGERALRFRAARQFERRGAPSRAFDHALLAFEAMPTPGVSLALVVRLSERLMAVDQLFGSIDRISSAFPQQGSSVTWLRRVAELGSTHEQGQRQRIEVLFRALSLQVDQWLLAELAQALRALVAEVPDERDGLELRLRRALREARWPSDGFEQAPVALAFAGAAWQGLQSAVVTVEALRRAVAGNPLAAGYAVYVPAAAQLAGSQDDTLALVAEVKELQQRDPSLVGAELLDLVAQLAECAGEPTWAARLLFAAAQSAPTDLTLAVRAEAVARRSGDSELLEAVHAALPAVGQMTRLEETAAQAELSGQLEVAVAALEQLIESLGLAEAQRAELTDRLVSLYRALGYRDRLEHRLTRELERMDAPVAWRVRCAKTLAAQYAAQGDASRAFQLLDSWVESQPEDADLLYEMARLARETRTIPALIQALTRLLAVVHEAEPRGWVLAELATTLDQQGDPLATTRWAELLELRPEHGEALAALEREAEARGDWASLVELLGRRAASVSLVEDVRRIRMRRALILEQRLENPEAARSELEQLLAVTGDNRSVLCVLADLEQRLGNLGRAGSLWWRAAEGAREPAEIVQLGRRACLCHLQSGEIASARRVLEDMESRALGPLRDLRVEIARREGDPLVLAEALEECAEDTEEPPERRATLLIEAAQAAESGSDFPGALARARAAVRLAPTLAAAQLTARLLEYRARGAGSPQEARATLAELRGIEGKLTPPQAELRAFLTAEALDVTLGGGAGLRELTRASHECGHRPLIELGLAERLMGSEDAGKSLAFFEAALRADLLGVRSPGRVALIAARVAVKVGETSRALAFLDQAARDPRVRGEALALRVTLSEPPAPSDETYTIPLVRRTFPDLSAGPTLPVGASLSLGSTLVSATSEDFRPTSGSSPAPVEVSSHELVRLAESAPTSRQSPTARSRESEASDLMEGGRRVSVEVIGERPRASRPALSVEVIDWPKRQGSTAQADSLSPGVSGGAFPSLSAVDSGAFAVDDPILELSTTDAFTDPDIPFSWGPPLERAEADPAAEAAVTTESSAAVDQTQEPDQAPIPRTFSSEPAIAWAPAVPSKAPPSSNRNQDFPSAPLWAVSSRRPSSWPPVVPADATEEQLLAALERGVVEAGYELAARLDSMVDRRTDRVNICRCLCWLLPGDRRALDLLYSAALDDSNLVYASALDHARHVFGADDERVLPPPLAAQPEEPERLRALLFRDIANPGGEALAIVWEGAAHLFRREPASYGVTGMERIGFGAPTVLSRLYTVATRALGINAPLFQRRAYGEPSITVLLLAPPALLVSGEVRRDTPRLAYHVGTMLAATLAEHVMLFGATEEQVQDLLRALALAFGAPTETSTGLGTVAKLAESLWECIPARAQRRLREICHGAHALDFGLALGAARRAGRRAGLLVCGDLGVAVEEVAAEVGFPSAELWAPDGLSAACAARSEIADIVRVASSPEYAEARWRAYRPR